MSGMEEAAQDAHSLYYLALLGNREADLKGRRQLEALDEIEQDFENIRVAWQYGVYHEYGDFIGRASESLFVFCQLRSRFQEGRALFELAHGHFAPRPNEMPQPVWGRSITRYLMLRESREEAQAAISASLATARKRNDQAEIAFGLRALGVVAKN